VIKLCDEISEKSASESDLQHRNELAKGALRKLIEEAGRRIQGHPKGDTGRGVDEA
jgi:hypothetical protein